MPNVQNRVDMWECVLSKSRSLFVRLAADFTVRCLELGNENLGNFEISGNLFLSNAQTANCTVLIPSEAWNHGNSAVIKPNNKFNKCWNHTLYPLKRSLKQVSRFSFNWKHLLTVFCHPSRRKMLSFSTADSTLVPFPPISEPSDQRHNWRL